MSVLTFSSIYKLSELNIINKMNREKKKQFYRKTILETYKKLITSVGFDAATTALLSKETGLAQGTIFNHFSTKGDLLLAVYNKYFFMDSTKFLEENPFTGKTKEWLLKYLNSFIKTSEDFPKECLKALFSLSYNAGKKKTYLEVENLDRLYLKEFKSILSKVVGNSGIDLDFLIELLYSLLMTRYSHYSLSEVSFNDFSSNIIKDIDKLFKMFSLY